LTIPVIITLGTVTLARTGSLPGPITEDVQEYSTKLTIPAIFTVGIVVLEHLLEQYQKTSRSIPYNLPSL
jgi:hypothetical protein